LHGTGAAPALGIRGEEALRTRGAQLRGHVQSCSFGREGHGRSHDSAEHDGTFVLREEGEDYTPVFAGKNVALGLDPGRFWEEKVERQGT